MSTIRVDNRFIWTAKYLGSCRFSVTDPHGVRGIYSVDAHAMGHTAAAAEAVRLHSDRLFAKSPYATMPWHHLDMVGGLLKNDTYVYAVTRRESPA